MAAPPACGSPRAKRSRATKSVICSVTPTQLYERLLGGAQPARATADAVQEISLWQGQFPDPLCPGQAAGMARRRARQGRAAASDAGLDGVSKACNEAARGMLPEVPTICVGQPHALDPSRCPAGQGDPVAATARGAAPHQGRRRRQARRAGRRQMDRSAARSLCRPRRGDPRQPYRRFQATASSRAAPIRRPISKR